MKRLIIAILALPLILPAAGKRAKNVILFIGDAGGIPTLSGASIHGYGQPQKLFIQSMPHLGLMDTSSANSWVTDSAAAMSAIVTGQKTNNGVLSQTPPGANGAKGEPLKTILEYAEERGLSTGVVSNSPMSDATPAACYAHSGSRSNTGEIFSQVLSPRFGDGVDLVIGYGRKTITAATAKLGLDLEPALKAKGYAVSDSLEGIPADARRVVALFNSDLFEMAPVVARAISILSRNPKGFFLMVESDVHTNKTKLGLDRAVALDKIIRDVVTQRKNDTLIIFAADHSFDFRVRGGKRTDPLLPAEGTAAPARPSVRVDDGHTGEEVLVVADGPGSERVHGFFANTDLFHIMLAAYGWEKPQARGR